MAHYCTNLEKAKFFTESARLLADKTKDKNIVRDACIVNFINTISSCNFGFTTKDIYIYDNRNFDDINIIPKNYISNFLKRIKNLYYYDIMMSNENCNTPKTHLLLDKHMYDNIDNLEISNRDIIEYIDKFLIHTGKCCGVNIDKFEIYNEKAEFFYNLEQNNNTLSM